MSKARQPREPAQRRAANVAAEVAQPAAAPAAELPEQPQGETRAGGQNAAPTTLPEWAVELSPEPRLRPAQARPTLPAELADQLSPQDTALVWALVGGSKWQEALNSVGAPPDDERRKLPPSLPIRTAAEWLVEAIAESCGLSRRWILSQWVALYGRAASPAKLDGATAAKCLTALGEEIGVGRKRKQAEQFTGDQVADLLLAIGRRGKPALDPARGLPRLVGASSAAPQQPGEKPEESGPASGSAVA